MKKSPFYLLASIIILCFSISSAKSSSSSEGEKVSLENQLLFRAPVETKDLPTIITHSFKYVGEIEKSPFLYSLNQPLDQRQKGTFTEDYDLTFFKDTGSIFLKAKLWQGEKEETSSTVLDFQSCSFLENPTQACTLVLTTKFDKRTQKETKTLTGNNAEFTVRWDATFKYNSCGFSDKGDLKMSLPIPLGSADIQDTYFAWLRRDRSVHKAGFLQFCTTREELMSFIATDSSKILQLAGSISSATLSKIFPINQWLIGKENVITESILMGQQDPTEHEPFPLNASKNFTELNKMIQDRTLKKN